MSTAGTAGQRGAKTVNVNGIDIAYVDVGDGPPLVLLHGALASTGLAWAGSTNAHVDHLPSLAEHFRVIAPDTRGSGATATLDAQDRENVVEAGAADLGGVPAAPDCLAKRPAYLNASPTPSTTAYDGPPRPTSAPVESS